jgi:DNA-binding response OmpR family regulator
MNTPRTPKFTKVRRASGQPGKYQMKKSPRQPEILLIEDGSGLFNKIGVMLQDHGFQVTLAQDVKIASDKVRHNNFAAIIVGASRLDILAAAKEKRTEIKTMVVTSLNKPELPVQAYEMEIDDYIHWPQSSGELSGRIIKLLEPGGGGQIDEVDYLDSEAQDKLALIAMDSLVEGFTSSLAKISQSLAEIRQNHLTGLGKNLSEELLDLAAKVQNLSDNMRHCWQSGETAEPGAASIEKSLH